MLVSHGVQPIEAQRLVTSLAKGTSLSQGPTGFFELYGQGGLARAAKTISWIERGRFGGTGLTHRET